ncbi:MAG: DNA polymerase Y family protein [Rhodospirillales bacterium]
MRRILSLWLPHLASETWRLTHRPAAEAEAPFALVEQQGQRQVLAALDPAAAALGLTPGQPLAAARAQVPDLRCAARRQAGEARRLEQIAAWCQRYTPWVASDPLGDGNGGTSLAFGGGAGLYLDVTGCAHLCGGEEALLADLIRRLARLGHEARAGLAATPGAAWALARFVTAPRQSWARLAAEEQEAALDPLPPTALRLSAEAARLLDRLGVARIADLRRLPAASLTARVGGETLLRLRQALGRVEEPLSPSAPVALPWVRQAFAEPLLTPEAVAAVLDRLIAALSVELERRELGARRLEAVGHRVDGSQVRLTVGTSSPSRDPQHLSRLAAPQRDLLDPGYGLEVLTLAAPRCEPLGARQLSSSSLLSSSGPACDRTQGRAGARDRVGAQDLATLVDRLQSRLGPGSVARPRARARHRPELAVAHVTPFAEDSRKTSKRDEADWPETLPPRPLLLLPEPERLSVMALLPDHPPRRLDWRHERLQVTRAEGPERLEPTWWEPQEAAAPPRDYYRLEVEDGRRLWVFRAGPKWFLQGLFA